MFGKLSGGGGEEQKQPSAGGQVAHAAGQAAKDGAKKVASMIGKKILAMLAPAFPYILIGVVAFIAIMAAAKTINDIVSFFSGTDPFVSEVDTSSEIKDLDLNDEERLPGLEQADELVGQCVQSAENNYDPDCAEPGSGVDSIKTCDPNTSLWDWLDKKFNGNFANACDLINYMNVQGKELEEKYNKANPNNADKIMLDRGLLVSTFMYSYVYRDKESEEVKEDEDTILSSGDPITIMNYMIKEGNGVKIKTEHIDKMYEHQVVPLKYIKLEWGITRTEEIEGVVHKYYGCKSSLQTGYVYDSNMYRLFLRDSRDEIIGSTGNPDAKDLTMNGTGYIGAINFAHTITESTSYCLAGDPKQYFGPAEHLDTVRDGNNIPMEEAQDFIKMIREGNKNDASVFLKKANFEKLEADNLSFNYNSNSYKIDYSQGFIDKEFSFFKKEGNATQKPKSMERVIYIIFSNAVSLNQSLNFPYHEEDENEDVTSVAIVIGEEAAPLGDFKWVITSYFGPREAPKPGASTNHGAIDMAGTNIDGSGIYAWKGGKVVTAGFSASCGNYVRIEHETLDGTKVQSLYCHMKVAPFVTAGETVKAGTLIGKVGTTGVSTGPHLHFGIEVGGKPVDPCPYIKVGRTCEEAEH